MEANNQTDQLNFNMDRDSNINQINNAKPIKKTRGRPKITDTQPLDVKPPSNKAIINLENKLQKLQKAEVEYNDALQNLNNQVKPTPKPKSKAKPRKPKIEDIITDN